MHPARLQRSDAGAGCIRSSPGVRSSSSGRVGPASSRRVAKTRTGSSRSRRSANRSAAADKASTHCKSSMAKRSGARAEIRRSADNANDADRPLVDRVLCRRGPSPRSSATSRAAPLRPRQRRQRASSMTRSSRSPNAAKASRASEARRRARPVSAILFRPRRRELGARARSSRPPPRPRAQPPGGRGRAASIASSSTPSSRSRAISCSDVRHPSKLSPRGASPSEKNTESPPFLHKSRGSTRPRFWTRSTTAAGCVTTISLFSRRHPGWGGLARPAFVSPPVRRRRSRHARESASDPPPLPEPLP